jgi:hypothetical protein
MPKHIYDVKLEVELFLEMEAKRIPLFYDHYWMCNTTLCISICLHMNELNKEQITFWVKCLTQQQNSRGNFSWGSCGCDCALWYTSQFLEWKDSLILRELQKKFSFFNKKSAPVKDTCKYEATKDTFLISYETVQLNWKYRWRYGPEKYILTCLTLDIYKVCSSSNKFAVLSIVKNESFQKHTFLWNVCEQFFWKKKIRNGQE